MRPAQVAGYGGYLPWRLVGIGGAAVATGLDVAGVRVPAALPTVVVAMVLLADLLLAVGFGLVRAHRRVVASFLAPRLREPGVPRPFRLRAGDGAHPAPGPRS